MHDRSQPPRTALVTGAARRIGAAIARALHGAGMCVAVHYHQSGADAEALVAELNAARADSAFAVAADLLAADAAPALVDTVNRRAGALDVLVNNASSFYPTPLADIDEAQWQDLLGTNLKAPLWLSQAAVPHLRQRQGAIVNLVDIHAHRPLADHAVYCAAKAGLEAVTRTLAQELGPAVRVNAVAPGAILWPDGAAPEPAEQARVLAQTPLARLGEPREIAAAVLFLVRDATYTTGHTLTVDGGKSLV